MNIELHIKKFENHYAKDDISDDLLEFQYKLAEIRHLIDGEIIITFSESEKIFLDLYSDFYVCFDEIIESIMAAVIGLQKSNTIWFCEQGSDFYINYTINNDSIYITFKKGTIIGLPNKLMKDFTVIIGRNEYILKWVSLFNKIVQLFKEYST